MERNPASAYLRKRKNRVFFGNDWLRGSILDLYKEDISLFDALLTPEIKEDSFEEIKNGRTPQLTALRTFNSSVYRWNRPCYGVSPNGQAHLRIENRVMSAGPTILDQMANAAFWFGTMIGIADSTDDITKRISFRVVKENFKKAAQYGFQSKLSWYDNQVMNVCQLILEELLPIARKGLKSRNIAQVDIDRYLTIIEQRTKSQKNGAVWIRNAYEALRKKTSDSKALEILTAKMVENQKEEKAIHRWNIPGYKKY